MANNLAVAAAQQGSDLVRSGEACGMKDDGAAKKNLETAASLAARDAVMKSLVKSEELVNLGSLLDASVRERQGQCGTKRKPASVDEKENRSSSRNATNKRRKKQQAALQDILNQHLLDDQAALDTYANQDHERHAEQVSLLRELVTSVRGLNDHISWMRTSGSWESSNVRHIYISPRSIIAPAIWFHILDCVTMESIVCRISVYKETLALGSPEMVVKYLQEAALL
ncbi:hypothetical protein MVEN_00050200 [Mycena venus]|uniref:Uncharacterized protein n=1 Tax=Mycena venus TaxID=2733690 RepID=A0A8H6Z3I4_9AGAR|nr:hypothetical protein MVEN_00050200 [Mycena venus]